MNRYRNVYGSKQRLFCGDRELGQSKAEQEGEHEKVALRRIRESKIINTKPARCQHVRQVCCYKYSKAQLVS